jgi:hypothetical protein
MKNVGVKIVLFIGFMMLISPFISYYFNHPGTFLITVPASVYGLLTCISGYISSKDDKWVSVALVIAVVGSLLTVNAFLMAWLSQTSSIAGALFWVTLAIIGFLDLSLFSLVMKMEVFNYFDEH